MTEDVSDKTIEAIVRGTIDWAPVDEALARHADASLEWLCGVLGAPVREETNDDLVHDALVDKVVEASARLREAQEELGRAREEAEAVRQSRTYAAGKAVTWLPRKLRDLLKGRRG